MAGTAPPTGVGAPGRASIAAGTLRQDRWWLPPLATAVGLIAWLVYATVRAASQRYYWVHDYHYLTPFASPCLSTSCAPGSSHFGTPFGDFPPLVPYAILTLPFLLLFRLTCYYYRKAYYRSFWLSPPACAVAEPHAPLHRRDPFPAGPAERPPLLLLRRRPDLAHQHVRRAGRLPRQGRGLRLRPRQPRPAGQRPAPVGLHHLVPLLPQHHRRPAQPLLQAPGPALDVGPGVPAQRAPHGSGVDHARVPRGHRRLRRARRGRHDLRPQVRRMSTTSPATTRRELRT